MSAILGTAAVLIRGDMQQLGGDLDQAKGKIVSTLSMLGGPIGKIAALAGGIFGVGALINSAMGTIGEGIAGFSEAEEANKRMEAVLKATGGAAGFTADQLRTMAGNLQALTTHDADAVAALQAKLLTFKKVTGDVFTEALELSLDLADAGFGSAEGAVLQLGKALENPTKGMAAMARSGITFTDAEQKKIKALQESGKLLEAQTIILEAVKGQVGGVARELAKTDSGRAKQLANMLGDAQERLGAVFLPIKNKLTEVAIAITNTFTTIVEKIKPYLDTAIGYVADFIVDVQEWYQAGIENFELIWSKAPEIMRAVVMTILDYWLFWREALPQYIGYGIRAAFDLWLKWLKTMYSAVLETIFAIGKAFLKLPGLIRDAFQGGEGAAAIGEGLKKAFDIAIAPLRGTMKGLGGELPDWSKALKPTTLEAWDKIADDLEVIAERKKELEGMRGGGKIEDIGKAHPKGDGIGKDIAEEFAIEWNKLGGYHGFESLGKTIQEQLLKQQDEAGERTAKASEGALVKLDSMDKHLTTIAMESKKDKSSVATLAAG